MRLFRVLNYILNSKPGGWGIQKPYLLLFSPTLTFALEYNGPALTVFTAGRELVVLLGSRFLG